MCVCVVQRGEGSCVCVSVHVCVHAVQCSGIKEGVCVTVCVCAVQWVEGRCVCACVCVCVQCSGMREGVCVCAR